jgi:hypothetical protein
MRTLPRSIFLALLIIGATETKKNLAFDRERGWQ